MLKFFLTFKLKYKIKSVNHVFLYNIPKTNLLRKSNLRLDIGCIYIRKYECIVYFNTLSIKIHHCIYRFSKSSWTSDAKKSVFFINYSVYFTNKFCFIYKIITFISYFKFIFFNITIYKIRHLLLKKANKF